MVQLQTPTTSTTRLQPVVCYAIYPHPPHQFLIATQIQMHPNRTSVVLSISHPLTVISLLSNYSSSTAQMLICGIRTKKLHYTWPQVTGTSRLHKCCSRLDRM